MTASYTSRWLLHSMHYQLAVRGGQTDNPDQRISEDIGGFISGEGGRGTYMNVGIYNYTIAAMTTATNLVAFSIILWGLSGAMDPTIFGVTIPGFLFWVAVLYACFATGMMQLIGRSLSRLMFRQQAVEANFRFDLARIREFSEQIALLKGEDREIDRAGRVFNDVFTTVQRIIRVRTFLNSFLQFYTQISAIIPYVVVAPFYFVVKKVDFGTFNQAADAFSNVNCAMNFFVNQYTGLAAFSATIQRLTSFEEAFARARADEEKKPRIEIAAAGGPILSIPDLDLALPDGRKLAHVGDLALIPQEPTLSVGPSGVGKSTLFRAIAGIWSFGSGEIHRAALRQAHAVAAAALHLQRPAARGARLPGGKLELLRRRAARRADQGRPAAPSPTGSTTATTGRCGYRAASSSGSRWRARCSREPDWLFLDEATASLDEKSEADLYRAIAETLPETTLVSIGHRSTLNAFHKRRIAFEPHARRAGDDRRRARRRRRDRRRGSERAGEPHRAARSLDHEIAVDQVPFGAAEQPGQEARPRAP